MPKFVYTPEGATPKSWDFDPMRMLSAEVEVIERKTGMTFKQWNEALTEFSFTALHGLLFVYLKREIPTLKWEDVVFMASELDIEADDDEPTEDDEEAPKA